MNIVKIWENDNGKNILVRNKETYYLLKEEYITGTGIKNWYCFSEYNNDKDFLISEDTEECDLQDEGSYATLFDCLKEIKERKEEW